MPLWAEETSFKNIKILLIQNLLLVVYIGKTTEKVNYQLFCYNSILNFIGISC